MSASNYGTAKRCQATALQKRSQEARSQEWLRHPGATWGAGCPSRRGGLRILEKPFLRRGRPALPKRRSPLASLRITRRDKQRPYWTGSGTCLRSVPSRSLGTGRDLSYKERARTDKSKARPATSLYPQPKTIVRFRSCVLDGLRGVGAQKARPEVSGRRRRAT